MSGREARRRTGEVFDERVERGEVLGLFRQIEEILSGVSAREPVVLDVLALLRVAVAHRQREVSCTRTRTYTDRTRTRTQSTVRVYCRSAGWHWAGRIRIPGVLSLSRTRNVPAELPGSSSRRSASFLLMRP